MKIVSQLSSDIYYLPGVEAIAFSSARIAPTSTPDSQQLTVSVGGGQGQKAIKIAPWGDGNDKPQQVYKEVKKAAAVARSLGISMRVGAGNGIRYAFKTGVDKSGDILEYRLEPEIDKFFKRSKINSRYLAEAICDLKWFGNVFPEIIFSQDSSKILSIVAQEASFCRWQEQNKQGYSENCVISAEWPLQNNYAVVPSFDPYDYDIVSTLRQRKLKKAIYPLSFPSPQKIYYQEPDWWGVIESGWLGQLLTIPKVKEAILKNQMNIKFLIRYPDTHFPNKYPGDERHKSWDEMDQTERDNIIRDELKKLNELLSGVERSGTSIVTMFKTSPDGKDYAKWEIEAITNPIKDGQYTVDSQEATAQCLYAVGIDPSIFGLSIGGKGMGAGSGSDKRIAFNILDALQTLEREIILEPLYMIAEYNGWPENIVFYIEGHRVATLDSGQEVAPPKQTETPVE